MTSDPHAASLEKHPSHLALELWAFAPESEPGDSEVGTHLAGCARCASTVKTWREERAAFNAQRPARAFLESVTAPTKEPAPIRRIQPARRWGLGLALAASLLAFVGWQARESAEHNVVHLKGDPGLALEVLASRDGAPATPAPLGVVLGRGDLLRFAVSLPQEGYVFIANVDATGRFTRYFPQSAQPERLGPATRLVLPGSIALDDFVGDERLVLVFSPAPLEEARIAQALALAYQRAGLDGLVHADLPASMTSVPIRKEAR